MKSRACNDSALETEVVDEDVECEGEKFAWEGIEGVEEAGEAVGDEDAVGELVTEVVDDGGEENFGVEQPVREEKALSGFSVCWLIPNCSKRGWEEGRNVLPNKTFPLPPHNAGARA